MVKRKQTTLEGVKEAERTVADLIKALKGEELREALLPAARYFIYGAKRRAPYDPDRKKGWHIRDALFIDTRDHGDHTNILVGVNHKRAPHAHLFELGWSKKPEGQPFLRPTATEDREAILILVGNGVKKVVEYKLRGVKRLPMAA